MSHILSRVRIENFRSIKGEEIAFSAFTPLVGRNNAGKSNILAATRWLLRKYLLAPGDYHDAAHEVTVEGEVVGITEEVLGLLGGGHAQKVRPFLSNEAISLRRVQAVNASAVKDIRLELLDPATGDWAKNPTGLDQALQALFPEPIVIGAMENAADDVGKFGKSTSIGRLLTEIFEPIREKHAQNIREALSTFSSAFSADSPDKDGDLVALDTMLAGEVEKFFPGISPKTHIPTPGLDDFMRGGTIKVFEAGAGAEGRDAASMGHGAQRSIQMGLVTCLSEVRKAKAPASPTTTLLMLDEPELYLHPQAVELVRSALHSLSERGYQVLFSTHSPNMILRQDAPNVVLVRKSEERGTHARRRLRDAVQAALEDYPTQVETLFSLTNSPQLLFTERVLLIEGTTELRVLPEVYRLATGKSLGEHQVGLIALDGAAGIMRARAVLQAMDIPTVAVVDLDFAFRNASPAFIEADCAEVAACRECLRQMAVQSLVNLAQDGFPARSATHGTASAQFELLAEHADALAAIEAIHLRLRQHGFWLWQRGSIEKHLGLPGKKAANHAVFLADLTAQGDLSRLPDHEGVRAFCAWVTQ